MDERHNHAPYSKETNNFINRAQDITNEHRRFITNCAMVLMTPKNILTLFQQHYRDAPHTITMQDVKNIAYGNNPLASEDAHVVLQLLIERKDEDPRWHFKYKVDDDGRLTHLFWMSPRQRELAGDLHQIVIHDNTYKTNRFKLPFGVFCSVNRHGQTVTTTTCLSFKEGTADYEWAYKCYHEGVHIAPLVVFTDADPGATAVVASV